MGFGYGTRNAEEVQHWNGKHYDFKTIKERYEQTIPIRGKRAKLDIRPHGQRDRCWERIVKVNENEYYLTNDAYRYYERPDYEGTRKHQRLMSFKQEGDIEYFTLHTPRAVWRADPEEKKLLYPHGLSAPSTFWFIAYNMPKGLGFMNIKTRKYIDCEGKFYSAEKGDVVFTRKGSNDLWKPLVVHREVIHLLDREKTKQVREQAKDFLNYAKVMSGLVDGKWNWGHHVRTDHDHDWQDKVKMNDDGSYPEHWLPMVEHYKHTATRYWAGFDEKSMRRHILKDLYESAKPCKEIEVPLGEACYDKFRNWYI